MRSTRLRNTGPVQTVDLANDSDSDGCSSFIQSAPPDAVYEPCRVTPTRPSTRAIQSAPPDAVGPGSVTPIRQSTRSRTFTSNERVYAYDQGMLYEARIVKMTGSGTYHVHYLGYKKSQDRLLTQDFLLKMTRQNIRRFCLGRGVSFTEEVEQPKAEMGQAPCDIENSRAKPEQSVQEVTPEKVESSSRCDAEDYFALTERYIKPRIRENAELASGLTLRRQVRSCFLDQNTHGFKELKKKVNSLLQKEDHDGVYSLLCGLRDFEINPRRVPETFRSDFGEVMEVVDLSQDDECIDIDEYILNTILARPDPAISSESALACPNKSCCVTWKAVQRLESCFAKLLDDFPTEARQQSESKIPECLNECSPMHIKAEGADVEYSISKSSESVATKIMNGTVTPTKPTAIVRVTPEPCKMNKTVFIDSEVTDPTKLQLFETIKAQTDQKEPSKKNRKRRAPDDLKSHFVAVLPDKVSDHAVARNTRRAKRARRKYQLNQCCETVITPRRVSRMQTSRASLQKRWNEQQTRRRNGSWTPSGHITGKWKPPSWSSGPRNDGDAQKRKSAGCRKSLLVKLTQSISSFMLALNISSGPHDASSAKSLLDVKCLEYTKPSLEVLYHAHSAIRNMLPAGDCEEWDVVKLSRSYYDYWRPDKVKVILLAESHSFTTSERAFNGPGFGALRDAYFGPRNFISLVYNLSYGENDSLGDDGPRDKNNKGTPQFWTLFAACSRGVHFQPTACSKKSAKATFAADLLKGGGLDCEER